MKVIATQNTIIELPEIFRQSLALVKEPRHDELVELNRSESTYSDSSDSTVSTKTRHVGFQEEWNEVYEGTELSLEESEALWYTAEEIVHFYDDCRAKAATIQAVERLSNDSHFWTKGLLFDYHLFCTSNEADLGGVIGSAAAFHSAALTGMEIWAIKSIDEDIKSRTKQLQEQIFALQAASFSNEDRRAEFIGRAARTWSRPSRLFAQHIAQAAVN